MSASNASTPRVTVLRPEANQSDTAESNTNIRPRLLIVDDISDNRTILTRRFQRRGFEVVEADSGLAAIELISRESFDLVLLDVMMPGIDGIETLKRIRGQQAALPVIMVTAKSESSNIVDALELGANDYVTKPVDFAVALARVNTQISRKRAEQQVVAANEELRRANEDLERRVEERTSRLIDANQRLKVEIADREELQAKSQYLAYHDSLTGLGNRLLFKEHLEEALSDVLVTPHPVAVLFLDLDGFKSVNDTLGHSVGDLLLKSVAIKLRDILQPTDRIARLGGDEFAILQMSTVQPGSSITLAEEILAIVGQPFDIDGHDLTVGASIGIALGHPGETDAENILKCADLAMYSAKSDGRGTYRMFDPEMDSTAQARRILERELRTAFSQNEFKLFYQPLVNLQTKKVKAFEALMRWEHPERGLVSPSGFIQVAEEMGLIVQLGEWALRQACAEAMGWPDEISVSVNLSALQFSKGNLVSTVINALASSGLPGPRLELEITESILLEKSERNISILSQLRGLGVRISMDDFGTGYSSIGYLRSFPFDKIKIDQSFVRDLLVDEGSLAIVRAITGLGISFGITTTAEGVETEEQLRCLNREGCVEVQGYFYSKPVPADEIVELLKDFSDRETQ
jgi:diguanylate cyclase (GGDEF)-like protein